MMHPWDFVSEGGVQRAAYPHITGRDIIAVARPCFHAMSYTYLYVRAPSSCLRGDRDVHCLPNATGPPCFQACVQAGIGEVHLIQQAGHVTANAHAWPLGSRFWTEHCMHIGIAEFTL
jgi:hypothetical protein